MITKQLLFIYFLLVALAVSSSVASQDTEEEVIRMLEEQERAAILKEDTIQLKRLLSSRIVVQNPENAIIGFRQVMDRIVSGKIRYASFERDIKNIAFIGSIAVVMGLETVVPKGESLHAGKTLTRRFTNVWMKENEVWKLTARQSTLIAVQ